MEISNKVRLQIANEQLQKVFNNLCHARDIDSAEKLMEIMRVLLVFKSELEGE